MNKLWWGLCLVVGTLLLGGCAVGTFEDSQYYTVQRGDTLSKIAATYDLNYVTLARQNNLQYPYILRVGQRLYVGTTPLIGHTDYANGLPTRTSISMGTESIVSPVSGPSQLSTQTLNLSQYSGPKPKSKSTAKLSTKKVDTAADGLTVSTHPRQKVDKVTWAWPVNGVITQTFGEGSNLLARGVQIKVAPKSKVLAAAGGQVIFSGLGAKGYNNMVIIKHGNNLLSVYTDLSHILVLQNEKVKLGQAIGISGTISGNSCLHFEIRKFGSPVNPLTYLPVPKSVRPDNKLKPISKPKMDSAV